MRQDLQMLRRHSAKAMELHFALYQSSHETIAEVYLRKLKATTFRLLGNYLINSVIVLRMKQVLFVNL